MDADDENVDEKGHWCHPYTYGQGGGNILEWKLKDYQITIEERGRFTICRVEAIHRHQKTLEEDRAMERVLVISFYDPGTILWFEMLTLTAKEDSERFSKQRLYVRKDLGDTEEARRLRWFFDVARIF